MNNIFILGPVASGKNTLLENIKKNYGVVALDTGRIFRFVAYQLYCELNDKFDFEKICNADESEIQKFTNKIFHLTKFIDLQLQSLKFDKDKMFSNDSEVCVENLYGKNVNHILSIIAKNLTIRKMIIKFIDLCISSLDKTVVMTGHNIREIDTTKFTVVFLDVEEKESACRLYERNKESYVSILDAYDEVIRRNNTDKIKETVNILPFLYNYIHIDTNGKTEKEIYSEFINKFEINKKKNEHFCSLQTNAIDREKFSWMLNPILEQIRKKLQQFVPQIIAKYPFINCSDLIYRTLILISAHKCSELLYNCKEDYLRKIEEGIINRNQTLYFEFIKEIEYGNIEFNEKIIFEELKSAMIYLLNLYSSDKVRLIMSRYNLVDEKNSFIFNKGLMIINDNGNTEQTTIKFKKIDSSISNFLSKYCHYLHTPREDEVIAYGAFVENEQYPIAYVSFSKQDRDYKKQLLYNLGIETQNSIEMTRAWCSNSAPQNIMSSLFQYSINELVKLWREGAKVGLNDKCLQAVTTTINPNLGFKASSFLGCNFIPIALRPAQFTFKFENGIISYETRRTIENSNSKEYYFENQLCILPLNEMILCLDKNKLSNIIKSKILLIDKVDYDKVLTEKTLIRRKEKNEKNINCNKK